ncbi:MAG: AAA family ATPase [Clostridiales bacterium]|nr:AAA family ATPase [Clostridiales bacterium]
MQSRQRLICDRILGFCGRKDLENPKVAIISGIRGSGKTNVLKHLSSNLQGAMYIDCEKPAGDPLSTALDFFDKGGIALVDEVSCCESFDAFFETLFIEAGKHGAGLAVIASSSPAHMSNIRRKQKNCAFFSMGPLAFEEYLVFTGKVADYGAVEGFSPHEETFADYLALKGVGKAFLLAGRGRAMADAYEDISIANEKAFYPENVLSRFSEKTLMLIPDIIHFSLENLLEVRTCAMRDERTGRFLDNWGKAASDEIYGEFWRRNVAGGRLKGLYLALKEEQLRQLNPERVAHALEFMIASDIISIEEERAHELPGIIRAHDAWLLEEACARYGMSLKSPLWWTLLSRKMPFSKLEPLMELFKESCLKAL